MERVTLPKTARTDSIWASGEESPNSEGLSGQAFEPENSHFGYLRILFANTVRCGGSTTFLIFHLTLAYPRLSPVLTGNWPRVFL